MRKALIIEHVQHEGLGIIGPALERACIEPFFHRVYENPEVPLAASGYSALIVMGGPMGVYENGLYPFIDRELELIKSALKQRLPVLGICLGSQLLAKAAGAKVYKGKTKEIGWYDMELTTEGSSDRLFLGLGQKLKVFQWHGDTFDLPPGAKRLASSKLFANQAIKVGPSAYGFQFHLEVTPRMIKDWIGINSAELEPLKSIDPAGIIKDIDKHVSAMHRYGETVLSRFMRLID